MNSAAFVAAYREIAVGSPSIARVRRSSSAAAKSRCDA
jgi:hypothetical protein